MSTFLYLSFPGAYLFFRDPKSRLIERTLKSPLDKFDDVVYIVVRMKLTKKQKTIVAHLRAADVELRKAMVMASGRPFITQQILDSEWYLDEAITRTETKSTYEFKKVGEK